VLFSYIGALASAIASAIAALGKKFVEALQEHLAISSQFPICASEFLVLVNLNIVMLDGFIM